MGHTNNGIIHSSITMWMVFTNDIANDSGGLFIWFIVSVRKLSNTYNKPNKKSARVVGDVIGKYHPHGDTAVYDAIVRMTQNFSLRYPLIQGQGNFGSIDGDSAAAMRYTEIRMQKITDQILADIEKETVTYSPNYDGTEDIPDVLPTRIPNLLVNGSSGIAIPEEPFTSKLGILVGRTSGMSSVPS